jgi:hypothetical protein
MNKKTIITALLTAVLALTSCHQSAQKTEAGQQADSSETVTNADTLRLVVSEKAEIDSVVQAKLKMPLDSIIVEMVNNTDCTFLTGEAYIIEHQVNGIWEVLPIRPREDGTIYAFPSIGYELAARASRRFTIHVQPDMYDFESGKEYRIGKEYSISGKAQTVYGYFTIKNE